MIESLDDRRKHTRVRLDGRVGGRACVLADFQLVAVSESGAELGMAVPLALESRCDITLNLHHVAVDLKGRVVNVQPPEESGLWHVGISFEDVDDLDRGLLEQFLERERQKA